MSTLVINVENVDKLTPLLLAVKTGSLKIVISLVQEEASINLKDDTNLYPIDIAARMDYLDIVKFFTEKNANITQDTLHFLVCNKRLDILKYLIDINKIDFTTQCRDYKILLYLAAEPGYLEMLDCLISRRVLDVNNRDKDDQTSLHLAAENGHLTVVKKLLEKVQKLIPKIILVEHRCKEPLIMAA
ncbi:ankyrin repeat domain-containing protein [Rickettsiella massiliensis]|uniref:ankyrin repeat domain-containing protein n=1 Tax=Rickettsiella massiliensis TaxID=676517 RepID=UPI00029AA7A2|nr:ankyrin repeat domain-containing protein [Rickettsiella massiliensis]